MNDERNTRRIRKLRARARHFRHMLDSVPHGVVVQAGGEIVFANDPAARLLGVVAPRNLVGTRYRDRVLVGAPHGAPHVEHQTLRRFDGGVIDVEATSRVITRRGRNHVLTLLREITDAHTTGDHGAERLRMAAEAESAIIMLDPIGDIVQWSNAAQRMTGYTAEEMVGRAFAVLISEDELERYNVDDILRQAVSSGRCHIEGWKRRKDGSGFYAAQSFTALLDGQDRVTGFALTMGDLSDPPGSGSLRHTEQQLRQAQRMEAVGRLASGIAHDFNNLLTAIQGHAQFLTEDLPEDHASRNDVAEILHSSERAAALTRQLLAFSRGQAAQPETIQINSIVHAMERLLRRVISEDIAVDTVLEQSLWSVRADPTQIEQVLVNLIVNARDAMPRGGRITIKTENAELVPPSQRHEELSAGQYVMLAVSDTGVGMDRETQARIFEPFFTTKGPEQGTGLGLSTVFGIVRQMGGHIFVYSEPGHGTTFKVYLPRAEAPLPQPPSKADTARERESVLIVEDDDSVRALARRVLETRGYRVWTCANADAALDIMSDYGNEMSLLISDVVMPSMSGHDLVETVRARWPRVGIIFMSGYTDEDVRRDGHVGPDDHFIGKPFTPEGLARKVRAVLDELPSNPPRNRP